MQEYSVLDSGNLRKLEMVGNYRIIRPALNAFWTPSLPEREWNCADAEFKRNSDGGGFWSWKIKKPLEFVIAYANLKFIIKPTDFGHLGIFPEQKDNWDWLRKVISEDRRELKTINLFAYSGASSLAMAQSGAKVCHIDSSKGMVEWARNNLSKNENIKPNIRWIVDDVFKFITKEIKRNEKYDGIVLDPPSFGRGTNGQIWKIENDIIDLLKQCKTLLSNKPKFILLSLHTNGFTQNTLSRLSYEIFGRNISVETGEMSIIEQSLNKLTAGLFARVLF